MTPDLRSSRQATAWNLTIVEQIARTDIATVWKVRDGDGMAALKVYHDGNEQDEGPGLDLLMHWQGAGAVPMRRRTTGAVLMDHLPGPSLGDMVRRGNDTDAAVRLATVARNLNAAPVPTGINLIPLATRCRELFAQRFAPSLSAPDRARIAMCVDLAHSLLADAPQPVALHGDLHHDNVLTDSDTAYVIDPKGVLGDPAYETANAFRNPVGADALWSAPERVRMLADTFAATTGQSKRRILGWATVHAALSLSWTHDGVFHPHPDMALIDIFRAAYDDTA